MTQFGSFVPASMVIRSGITQGLGLGLIFVPLSTLAFATLDAKYRTEAAGLFSLVRNVGSSIGISVVTTLLGLSIQTNHSYLVENITPYNTGLAAQFMPQAINNSTVALSMLNTEINKQAATIGYINDFAIMMWVVISTIPMVFLLRNPVRRKDGELPAMMAE
jgi:DHA2 family multidrug resistance protein